MLACTALVGCTDEVVVDNPENNKQSELVRGDAYVNFVINTATDSSRGTTKGDGHGDAGDDTHGTGSDANHHVAGVRTENAVNELLLVITKVNDDSETNELYGETKIESLHGTANGYVGILPKAQFTAEDGRVTLATPVRLDYTGKYKVLAVLNPVSLLKTAVEGKKGDHKEAYKAICEYSGLAYEEIGEGDSKTLSFQMSNRDECVIEATAEHNVPTNPITANINVERTVSKTTWRYTASFTEGVTVPTALANKKNLYEIKVNVGTATATVANYWFKEIKTATADGETKTYDAYYYGYNLNKATSTDGKTYWVLLASNVKDNGGQITRDDVTAAFENTFWTKAELNTLNDINEYTGVLDDQNVPGTDDNNDLANLVGSEKTAQVLKDDYQIAKERVTDAFVQSLTFAYTLTDADPEYYFIHLHSYALTNLADKVYAVRHTDNGVMTALTSTTWLNTPALSYTHTLTNVNSAAANLSISEEGTVTDAAGIFKSLPTATTEESSQVTDTEHYTDDDINGDNIGAFMEYLMENAPKTNQTADNITGIVFAGNIYDNDGNLVPVMYKYNGNYYRSLRALVKVNSSLKYTVEGKEYPLTENSTDAQATLAGVDVYAQGRCFYYSGMIKHFEDKVENNFGVMEYAIMRNNIYSLAVNKITEIGDAKLTLTPSTPISDIRAYVDLEVTILPWIVRFNDIEF